MSTLFGNRLIAARKMAGLSLQGLADRLEGIVTRQALSKYELNQSYPNSQTLIALSRTLNVPVDFFFSEPEVQVELTGFEFRKRKKLSPVTEAAILEQSAEILSRYLTLEQLIREEKPIRPFDYPHLIQDIGGAEQAAEQLRIQWGLGQDPIPNVVAMLEESGYKVVELTTDKDFDGLKAFAKDIRVIVVNRAHDICRIRFTALHELAHHVLMFPDEMPEQDREKLCHTFSGAVLFPATQAREIMNVQRFHFYLPELSLLKQYWGISIAAMFARAKNLGIINDYVFAKLNQGYRARKYHLNEPGIFSGDEKAYRFNQLLYKGLAEEIITISQGALLRNVTVGELRNDLDQLA